MTREEYESEVKKIKDRAELLAKVQEEGKIVEPKPKAKQSLQVEQDTGDIRDRIYAIREEIMKLGLNSSADSSVLRAKLERIELQINYIYDYVKGTNEPEPRKKFLGLF